MCDNTRNQSEQQDTSKIVLVFQAVAVLLILFEVLMPNSPMPFCLILSGFVLWLGLGMELLPRRMSTVRNLLLIFGCLWLVLRPPVSEWNSGPGVGTEAVFVSLFAWIFCLIVVQEGALFGFPIAMLAVITAALMPNPESSAWFLTIAALLLLSSGGVIFVDSLIHPRLKAARISKTRVVALSPPFMVAVIAFIVMLMTADLVRTVSAKVIRIMPMPDSAGNSRCALVTPPPKFNGEIVCRLFSAEGPLPKYLGEKIFWSYDNGVWRDGQACSQAQNGYGGDIHAGEYSLVPQGVCVVRMTTQRVDDLVPLGTLPKSIKLQEQDQYQKTNVKQHVWNSQNIPAGAFRTPAAAFTDVEKLYRLRMAAKQICLDANNDQERVEKVLHYLHKNMRYDMSAPFQPDANADPVEYFLFRVKRGWCIHFASAATLMLRAVDIPARMVLGYVVTGDSNSSNVLDSAGHAWCEALVESEGETRWVVVDPSARPAITIPLENKNLKMILVFLVAAFAVLLLAGKDQRVNVSDLRKELEREDPSLSDVERVRNGYERCIRMLARSGVVKPKAMPPRRFAQKLVPPEYRQDFLVITEAYERITYMGFLKLGRDGRNFSQAQVRLIDPKSA